MENLKALLNLESKTLGVVRSAKGETVRFTRRGVTDLFELVANKPDFTLGAIIADRVIGRGAALLIVKGGFAEVYARLISRLALDVLVKAKIPVEYDTLADNILNRDHSSICPVERLTADIVDPDEALKAIKRFISKD
ncbi:MAG: DUF1893 domain-containing protein [Muribaculaceae bacterium]|nr:DUF1893 domain-containing protein [Muribaculaceae bacterium]